MAINIPSIKRAEPVSQGSIGRDQTQAPSAEPYIKNLNTISNVFEKSADIAFKFEKQAQDTELRDLTNKYKASLYGTGDEKESWTVTRFQKTPKEGQDLTPAFAGYQEYKQTLRDQIMSSARGGVAERLKTELADVDFYADRTVNVEFYKANNVRTDKIHSAEIDLIKQVDIPAAVGAYNPKDPDTIKQLATTFGKIADSSMAHGLKLGFKEGDPLLQSMMREDVGEAVVKSVNDALSIKDTDKATQIWMQFQDMVPNKKAETIKAKIADIVIDKEIDTYVDKYMGMFEPVGMAKIDKEVPEELRTEVRDRYIKLKRQQTEQKNRISNEAENLLKNKIVQREQQGNPYKTVKEMENDNADLMPFLTNANDRLSAHNRIGVRSKAGDPEKHYRLSQEINSGLAKDWNYEQVVNKSVGLSTREFNDVMNKFEKRKEWSTDRQRIFKDVKNVAASILPNTAGVLTREGERRWMTIEPWLINQIETTIPRDVESRSVVAEYSKVLKLRTLKLLNDAKGKNIEDYFKVQNAQPITFGTSAPNKPTNTTESVKSKFTKPLGN